MDMDVSLIHDTILISSGLKQNLLDHPAFSNLMIYSIIVQILNIFDPHFIFNLKEILLSNNPDQDLQRIFFVLRFVNIFFCFFLIILFYKNLKILGLSKLYRICASLTLLFSEVFYDFLFLLKSEIVSYIFFLISNYFLIKFIKKNKKISLIISGLCFALAMFAKIQIIFCYIFMLFMLIPYHEEFSHKKKESKKNYYDCYIILIFIVYFFFQLYLNLKYSQFRFLDIIFFTLLSFFFITYQKLYFLIYGKIYINFEKIIFFFLIGSFLCLLIILGLDFLNIIKFSEKNILRLTNPLHYLSAYSTISPFTDKNSNLFQNIFNSIFEKSEFLKINTIYNFILFTLTFVTSLLALIKFKNKFFFKYAIIGFCYIFFIIFVTFKFRQNAGGVNTSYYIFFKPILLSILFLSFNYYRKKKIYILSVILIIATALNTVFFFKNFYPYNNLTVDRGFLINFNRESFLEKNCKNNFWNDDSYENYFLRLTPGFHKEFFVKICKIIKY